MIFTVLSHCFRISKVRKFEKLPSSNDVFLEVRIKFNVVNLNIRVDNFLESSQYLRSAMGLLIFDYNQECSSGLATSKILLQCSSDIFWLKPFYK